MWQLQTCLSHNKTASSHVSCYNAFCKLASTLFSCEESACPCWLWTGYLSKYHTSWTCSSCLSSVGRTVHLFCKFQLQRNCCADRSSRLGKFQKRSDSIAENTISTWQVLKTAAYKGRIISSWKLWDQGSHVSANEGWRLSTRNNFCYLDLVSMLRREHTISSA